MVDGEPSGVCSQSTFIMSVPTSPADWNRRSMSSAPDDGSPVHDRSGRPGIIRP